MHHGVSHRRLSPDELGDVTLKFARFSEGCFSMCCFHPTKRISWMSKTGFLWCCESGVDSDAFISSSQYMARCMSFTHFVICSLYHPIPISNPRAGARIVAHPHSTWAVSQMCPISPRSRHPRKQPYVFEVDRWWPVGPLRSGTGVLIPHLFGTRRATQKFSKSQSPNLFGQYR